MQLNFWDSQGIACISYDTKTKKKERWNDEKKTCWYFLYVSTQEKLPVIAQGTLALEHVSTQSTLAYEPISTQDTLACEHVFSTRGTQFSSLANSCKCKDCKWSEQLSYWWPGTLIFLEYSSMLNDAPVTNAFLSYT